MTRPPSLIKAQAEYEKKRNARKVLLRLSEEEAAFVDKLGPALGKFDATREQAIRELIRSHLSDDWYVEATRSLSPTGKGKR